MIDLSKYEEIIVWGASFPPSETDGDATSHGRAIEKLFDILAKKMVVNKVIAIVDSNLSLHGRKRMGIEVVDPSIIVNHPKAIIIINTISISAIENAMKKMGVTNDYVIIPFYFYHGTVDHPYINDVAKVDAELNGEKIRSLYDEDDPLTSRYLDIILSMRLDGEDKLYPSSYYEGTGVGINYFCDDKLSPKGDVTYIDIGAYNGDSIEPVYNYYGDRLKHIFAFEPDDKSRECLYEYLKKRGISNKTDVFRYALGNENKQIRFSPSGLVGQVDENGDIVLEQRKFDDLNDISAIGDLMIKMDIEGAELGALEGMRNSISNNLPYLAICIYHNEKDLFEIANFIKSIDPRYHLYIRGGWHLECWAVPQRHFE